MELLDSCAQVRFRLSHSHHPYVKNLSQEREREREEQSKKNREIINGSLLFDRGYGALETKPLMISICIRSTAKVGFSNRERERLSLVNYVRSWLIFVKSDPRRANKSSLAAASHRFCFSIFRAWASIGNHRKPNV